MGYRILGVALAFVGFTGCASGVYIEDLPAEARTNYEGFQCVGADSCGAGLECHHGACIRLCDNDSQCAGRRCLPLPESDEGWCRFGEAVPTEPSATAPAEPVASPEAPLAPPSPEVPDVAPPTAPTGPEGDEDLEGMTIQSVAPPPVETPEEPAPIVADESENEVDQSDEVEEAEEVEEVATPPTAEGVTPVEAPNCDELRTNQSQESAVHLADGARIEDAICAGRADFYRVSVEGFWLLQLATGNADQPLQVYLWDAQSNTPATGFDGDPITSVARSGDELLAFLGEQIVVVVGPEEERAAYELSLYAL